MSDGAVHLESSLILAGSFGLGAIISQEPALLTCAGGALVGILVGCDLDVDSGNISNRLIKKKVGWFGERLWRGFWKGYSSSFKHGQFASHFPIFSTFVRLSYIYFWLIFVPHSLIKLLGFFQWELMYVLKWYGIVFLNPMFFYGLASSDLIHWALDTLTTKRTERKK